MISERFKHGLWISLGVHLMLLIGMNGFSHERVKLDHFVRINTDQIEAVTVDDGGAVELGAFAPETGSAERKLIEERRRIYAEFLEEVAMAIHSHRLDFGHPDLIGIAAFTFVINPDGTFSNVRLIRTSGNPVLDDVARRATLAASGRVKRPKILGTAPIAVENEVRFQYGLR